MRGLDSRAQYHQIVSIVVAIAMSSFYWPIIGSNDSIQAYLHCADVPTCVSTCDAAVS